MNPGSTTTENELPDGEKVRAVVFGESLPPGVRERVSSTWMISRGHARFRSTVSSDRYWTAERLTNGDPETCLIDLDPAHSVDMQAQCLFAALRYPDDQTVVAYRGDQRFVPQSLAISRNGTATKPASWTRAELEALPLAQRRSWLEKHLLTEFKTIAGLELARGDMERPLQALGLDSLMAIQFRNRLDANLGITLSVVDFLKGLSLNQLVDNTLRQVATPTPNKPTSRVDLTPAVASDNLDKLSERELDRLLQAYLE